MPSIASRIIVPSPWLALALGCAALVAACDPQVSTAYTGEPLLLMKGSVELESAVTEGELQPALAFFDRDRAEIRIVEVQAEGGFPAEFTIAVYDPPPAAMLRPLSADREEPRAAIAFITAVTESHPETIQAAQHGESSARPTTCAGGPCPCPETGCVREQTQLCTHDGQTCYTETVTCPQSDSPEQDCTTTYSGDASLAQSPWRTFAGLSQNYVIVYVTEALAPGSPFALALGTRDGLASGYNLLAVRPLTADELGEQAECAVSAEETALARFNDEHGTSYDELQILGLTCAGGPFQCPEGEPECADCPAPASEEETQAYHALVEQIESELGCIGSSLAATRVADTEAEAITVRIAPGLRPPGEAVEGRTMGMTPPPENEASSSADSS